MLSKLKGYLLSVRLCIKHVIKIYGPKLCSNLIYENKKKKGLYKFNRLIY